MALSHHLSQPRSQTRSPQTRSPQTRSQTRDLGCFNAADHSSGNDKFAAELAAELVLSSGEMEIALDAIAQLIPHLDLQGCRKVAELAEAQARLIEIMDLRQRLVASPAVQSPLAA